MTAKEFENKVHDLRSLTNEKWKILSEKYTDLAYYNEEQSKEKFKDDSEGFNLYHEILNLDKQLDNMFFEYRTEELKNQKLYSDNNVDLSVAIEVHDILLEKGFYKEHLVNEDFDFVKVIYACTYNDNWNDLLVAKLQLFKEARGWQNSFTKEIVIFDETLYQDEEELYNKSQPYEIEMYDCKIYSGNEAYQSFIVSKEKCKLN